MLRGGVLHARQARADKITSRRRSSGANTGDPSDVLD
jgi:hypothetical protein